MELLNDYLNRYLSLSVQSAGSSDTFLELLERETVTVSKVNAFDDFQKHQPSERMQTGQSSMDVNADLLKGSMERNRSEGVQLPMSPDEALSIYGEALTELEREEILKFPQVWFVGHMAKKVQAAKDKPDNFGHDDKWDFYLAVTSDHIAYRYEILMVLGQGSFGQVFMCWDHKGKEFVAIKIIQNDPSARHSATCEVRILSALGLADKDNTHNVVRMKDRFDFRGHLCICFELLGNNLSKELKQCGVEGWSQAQVRRNAISLLKCLQLLKRERLVHGDLKPGNIVSSGKGDGHIKVIDFGLAFYENQRGRKCQTLWYRAPEVLLENWNACGTSMDMWSLGCTLAQFSTGKVLFGGMDEQDQMARIMEVLGLPPRELLRTATNDHCYFDTMGRPLHLSRRASSRRLSSILTADDPNFLDFIERCLKWDPKERLTPDEAMRHPWIVLHDQGSKPKVPTACKTPESFSSPVNKQQSLHSKTSSIMTAAAPKPSIREESPVLKREKLAPVRLAVMEERVAVKHQVPKVTFSSPVYKQQNLHSKTTSITTAAAPKPSIREERPVLKREKLAPVRLAVMEERVAVKHRVPKVTFSSPVYKQQNLHSKTSSITTAAAPEPSIREERPVLKREKLAPVRLAVMEERVAVKHRVPKVTFSSPVYKQQNLHSKTSSITTAAAPEPSIREERPVLKREKLAPVQLAVIGERMALKHRVPKVSREQATGQRLPQLAKTQQMIRGGHVQPVRLLQQDGVGQRSKPKLPETCSSLVYKQQNLHNKTSSFTTAAAPKLSIREERPLLEKEKMAFVRLYAKDCRSKEVLKRPTVAEAQKVARGGIVRAGRLPQEDKVGRSRGESRLGVRFPPL